MRPVILFSNRLSNLLIDLCTLSVQINLFIPITFKQWTDFRLKLFPTSVNKKATSFYIHSLINARQKYLQYISYFKLKS